MAPRCLNILNTLVTCSKRHKVRPSRTCAAQTSHVNLWSQSSYHSKHMRPSELISGGKERRAARILTQPQARLRILIFDPPKLGALEEFFNISCVCAWLSKRRRTLRVKMFHAGDARPNASTAKFTHAAAADKEQGEAVMRGEWRPGGKKKARSWRTRQVSRILTVERVLSTFPANTATDSMLSLCY